jgi:hypothetical protein
VLADRGFDAGEFLTELASTGAKFLVRLRSNRRLPVVTMLDDGSFPSRIGEMIVRIITAEVTVTCADGTRYTARASCSIFRPRAVVSSRVNTASANSSPSPAMSTSSLRNAYDEFRFSMARSHETSRGFRWTSSSRKLQRAMVGCTKAVSQTIAHNYLVHRYLV